MSLRNYALVTLGYWTFTVTDGALRMLVLLHFHDLGYSPVSLAFLFLAYEAMGVMTNLVGGWIGSRVGLQRILTMGLALQIVALLLLSIRQGGWDEWVSVAFVMTVQGLSGIAKDLTKMSSKSAVKFVASEGALFRWVAMLTGSKNALKGVGFFAGGAMLGWIGFDAALRSMAAALVLVLIAVVVLLDNQLGKTDLAESALGPSSQPAPAKTMLAKTMLAKSLAVNRLSIARFFLFGARDIWFVVALPVFLEDSLGWSFAGVGAFLASWVIGYGMVQSVAPRVVAMGRSSGDEVFAARRFAMMLAMLSGAVAFAFSVGVARTAVVLVGLILFGVVFALNSSLHSFLILAYSSDQVVADVGFYYSANAAGRLVGTLLSGLLFLWGGLELALWGSAAFVVITWLLSLRLPSIQRHSV